MERRVFLKRAFLGMGAFALGGGVVSFLQFMRPKIGDQFGGKVHPGSVSQFRVGTFTHLLNYQTSVTNLDPSDDATLSNSAAGASGLLACRDRCPHLGSLVTWEPDHDFGGAKGWLYCKAHSSTYTKAGVRVFGPAPRGLDTMPISFEYGDQVVIDTGNLKPGGSDNPKRAVPPPA